MGATIICSSLVCLTSHELEDINWRIAGYPLWLLPSIMPMRVVNGYRLQLLCPFTIFSIPPFILPPFFLLQSCLIVYLYTCIPAVTFNVIIQSCHSSLRFCLSVCLACCVFFIMRLFFLSSVSFGMSSISLDMFSQQWLRLWMSVWSSISGWVCLVLFLAAHPVGHTDVWRNGATKTRNYLKKLRFCN